MIESRDGRLALVQVVQPERHLVRDAHDLRRGQRPGGGAEQVEDRLRAELEEDAPAMWGRRSSQGREGARFGKGGAR